MNFSISNNDPYYANCTLSVINGKDHIEATAFYSPTTKSYALRIEQMGKDVVLTLQKVGRKTEKSFGEFLKRSDLLGYVVEFCYENKFSMPVDWLKREIPYGFYLPAISEPSYFFDVGDSVTLGHLKNGVITKVYESGKIYQVEYDKGNERNKTVKFWHELRPALKSDTSFTKNKDLRISFQNRTISSLIYGYYSGGIDMNPSYQRELVWSEDDKVSLINSIFHCVDIGKFVFVRLPFLENGAGDEILDGKQRINAIIEFYENRFRYKGKLFSELGNRDRCHFEGYSVSWADVPELTEEQKLRYFLMLNTSGKCVSTEHLNKIREMLEKEEE